MAFGLPGNEGDLPQAGGLPTTTSAAPQDFDANWYLQQNPDVARSAFASDPYAHYTMYGRNEGRLGMAPVAQTPSFGTVESLYQDVLNRPGDPEGLAYWKGQFGDTIDRAEYDQFMASARAELANRDTRTGTGVAAPVNMTASGIPYTNIANAVNQTLADPNVSAIEKANRIYDVSQQFGVTQEDIAKALNIPVAQVQGYFQNRTDYPIIQAYDTYLGRQADPEGLQYYRDRLAQGATAEQIASEIARSKESAGLRTPELASMFANQFDTSFINSITPDQMTRLATTFADPSKGADQTERYQAVLKEIALDPTLGPKLKEQDPMAYYTATPLTSDPSQQKTTERIRYGQYGLVNIGGQDVPILNAKVVDDFFGGANHGTMQDFSHGAGNYTRDLGWTSNSASNRIAKGADALGVTKQTSEVYGNQYAGLNEAARLLNIDPSQFQGKFVETQTVDEFGNPQISQTYVSPEDQLYDAINEASKDLYSVTMDSLTPGRAVEGGPQSFDTVFYKKAGDKLIPVTAPQASGGMQNAAVYRPKDYGFGYYSQGPLFVASGALAMMTAGAASGIAGAVSPAATIGSALGAGATYAPIVGSTILGAAMGALGANAYGGDIAKGALTGGATGLVASGMKPLMATETMASVTKQISDISQGLFTPAQVGNIVGSTLASTLGSAASGANGSQILDAFKVSLISSGLSEKAADLAKAGLNETFKNDPRMLERIAAATKLVTRTVSTSALSGANPNQIQSAVITALIQNAGDIASTGGTKKTDTKLTSENITNVESEEFFGIPADQVKQILADTTSLIGEGKSLQADVSGNIIFGESGRIPGTNTFIQLPKVAADLKADVDLAEKQDLSQGINVTGTRFTPTLDLQSYAAEKSELDNQLKNNQITEQEYKQYVQQLDSDFNSQLPGAVGAINLLSVLIGNKVPPSIALNQVSQVTGINKGDISKLISSTKSPVGPTGPVGPTTGVTGATGPGGISTVTGDTNLVGVTGGGAGVTGATGGGGGGEGTGEGGGGEGSGGTGTGGIGTGGTGTGTGTGGGGTGTGGGGGTGTGGGRPTVPRIPTIPTITAARKIADEDLQGIYNLTPGFTQGKTDYELAGQFKMADGGSVTQYDPYGISQYEKLNSGVSDVGNTPFIGSDVKMPKLTAGVTDAILDYVLPGLFKFAEGGSVPGGHNPKFFSEGGLNSLENRYVTGDGDGTSDSIPAMLANGEFVIPADVVSSLGNGSNDAGAAALDEFLKVIREHKQKHDAKKLPPDSKGPLAYLLEAKKRA